MFIYVLFYITNSILSFFKKNKFVFFFFGFLFMFALLALRSEHLGVDLDNYERYYDFYSKKDIHFVLNNFSFPYLVDKKFDVEFGYIFWGWALSKLKLSFHGFLVINSLVYSIVIAWFIGKYSKNPFLSLVLLLGFGIFEFNFCILRQSLSVCLLLLSIPLISKKKFKSYILLVLLAVLFHRSSAIFLPMYFLYKFEINLKRLIWSFIFICIAIPVAPFIYSILYNDILSSIGKGTYISKTFSLNLILLLFVMIHLLLIVFFAKEKNTIVLKKHSVFIYMCFIGEVLEIFATVNDSFGRVAIMTYLNGAIILIPNIVYAISDLIDIRLDRKSKYILINFAIIVMAFVLFIHSMQNSSMEIVPYITQFEEVEGYVG